MKLLLVLACMMPASFVFAQGAADVVTAQAAQAAQPASPAPAAVSPATQAPAQVSVPESIAPPAWVQEFLSTVSALPIVGPYVSKAMVYIGVLAMILTALVAFLTSLLAALKPVASLSGLQGIVTALENFQQSKIMFWLTAFSAVPVHLTPAAAAQPAPKA